MDKSRSILFKYLELNPNQYYSLLCLQKLLTINDIALTTEEKTTKREDERLRHQKAKWLEEWERSVCQGLKLVNLDQTEREIIEALKKR